MEPTTQTTDPYANFRKACELVQKAAAPLLKINKSKVEDSELKFLLIRAVRADHLAREVAKTKSLDR